MMNCLPYQQHHKQSSVMTMRVKDNDLQTILPHSFGSHFLTLELPQASTSYPSLVSYSDINQNLENGQP
jgi:hypothetical protein